jgi:iron complex outermembrane receptor protein
VELAFISQPASWWTLKGGYTFLKKHLWVKRGSKDANNATAESNDPQHQLVVQSRIILPARFELGTIARYVGKLPEPEVPAYLGLDLRLGWTLSKAVELNVVAQNVLNSSHLEFVPSSPAPREIKRSIFGKIKCRF